MSTTPVIGMVGAIAISGSTAHDNIILSCFTSGGVVGGKVQLSGADFAAVGVPMTYSLTQDPKTKVWTGHVDGAVADHQDVTNPGAFTNAYLHADFTVSAKNAVVVSATITDLNGNTLYELNPSPMTAGNIRLNNNKPVKVLPSKLPEQAK